jgi:putative tryptophan/tyrosine transport system substrate-binding protein
MRRRDFLLGLGASTALSLDVRAQQKPALIGFLSSQSASDYKPFAAAFRQGLADFGLVEGKEVAIEYRWGEGRLDTLPALAADLVELRPAVIAATGGVSSARAVKAATATIPIVFTSGEDPVEAGLVATFSQPGGNVTGISWFGTDLVGKRLAMMHELVPAAAVIAVLVNTDDPESETQLQAAEEAARALGCKVSIIKATAPNEIDAAFAAAMREKAGAVVVTAGPFFVSRREQIVALAAQYGIPTMHSSPFSPPLGGLIFYGNDLADAYRRNGRYVSRILRGARPAELPVDRSTKFEMVINLKTAKALGLMVPQLLLAQADEVIE